MTGILLLRSMVSRRWWWTTLLVLFGIAVTILLGIWQYGRYKENHTFNEHLTAMQAAPVLVLDQAALASDLTGEEYRAVQVTGTFDFSHQVAIRNQVWTQTWGDDMGYALLTPLLLPDGKAVLVERGWIPLKDNTPAAWSQYNVSGSVTLSGVIRLPAKPEMGGGVADPPASPGQPGLAFWNLVNITRLQAQMPYPLLPFYIQQTTDPSQSSLPYPYPSQPDPADDGSNLGYMFVWFSFTALLFFGYPVYLRNQGEQRNIKER